MLILGIDGGGTHTTAEIRRDDNTFLQRLDLGPFNPASIGEAAFRARLQELGQTVPLQDCAAICIGGAGMSLTGTREIIQNELENLGFSGKLHLCGDHEIALFGAVEECGIVLISGTGSICCGRNGSGVLLRCGGWGHILDDAGSGYAIGRDALAAAVRMADGRLEKTPFEDAILSQIGCSPVDFVTRNGKKEIAKLAKFVESFASSGDETALNILSRQAQELRQLVSPIVRQLGIDMPPLCLMGGMMEEGSLYRHLTEDALSDLVRITQPKHDAAFGAAQIAFCLLQ